MPLNVFAAKGDQRCGLGDLSRRTGRFGYAHDKFAATQIGGTMPAVFMNNTI